MAESDLQKRIERLGRLLVEEIETWEASTRDSRREAVRRVSQRVERELSAAFGEPLERRQRKADRKREEARRKKEEAQRKEIESSSAIGGTVLMVFAAVCLSFAVMQPELWWMVFVALGLGMGGAKQLQLASQKKRLAARVPDAQGAPGLSDSFLGRHEVDVLCDRLLHELKHGPEVVRTFLQNPEATVASLRTTCKALDERRRQLLAEKPAEARAQLEKRRDELIQKRSATSDPTARLKLDQALASLQTQAAALEQLEATIERIDGEYTGLMVMLEELRTRMSVARAAGSPVQLDALRANVTRLNAELEAIAEAVESAPREGLPRPIERIGEAGEPDDSAATAGRSRERV
jgi:hypothetical protein